MHISGGKYVNIYMTHMNSVAETILPEMLYTENNDFDHNADNNDNKAQLY